MNPLLITPGVRMQDVGTFLVASDEAEDVAHLVDLSSYGGNGACSCEQFVFRCATLARSHLHAPVRCKHIDRARAFVADCFTAQLKQQPQTT